MRTDKQCIHGVAYPAPAGYVCYSCAAYAKRMGVAGLRQMHPPQPDGVDGPAVARSVWDPAVRRVYVGDAGLDRLLDDLRAREPAGINTEPAATVTEALRTLEAAFVAMRNDYRQLQLEHCQLQQSVADTAERLRRMRDGLDRV